MPDEKKETGNAENEKIMIGNTKIKIYGDYCGGRTPAEIEKILNCIAKQVLAAYNEKTVKSK